MIIGLEKASESYSVATSGAGALDTKIGVFNDPTPRGNKISAFFVLWIMNVVLYDFGVYLKFDSVIDLCWVFVSSANISSLRFFTTIYLFKVLNRTFLMFLFVFEMVNFYNVREKILGVSRSRTKWASTKTSIDFSAKNDAALTHSLKISLCPYRSKKQTSHALTKSAKYKKSHFIKFCTLPFFHHSLPVVVFYGWTTVQFKTVCRGAYN